MASKTINDLDAIAVGDVAATDQAVLWDTTGAVSVKLPASSLLQAALNTTATGLSPTVVTPTALAASTDNWALATGIINRISASAAYNLTGIVAESSGSIKWLWNIGTFPITFVNELTSTAANRFTCTGGANIVCGPGELMMLTYSTTTSRWLCCKVRSDIGQGTLIVRQPGGVAGTDEAHVYHDGANGVFENKDTSGYTEMFQGTHRVRVQTAGFGVYLSNVGSLYVASADSLLRIKSTGQYTWSATSDATGSPDTGTKRDAAAVIATTNGSTGTGWLQNSAGTKRLTANVTSADTAMVNLTDLSMTLIEGRKYVGRLVLFAANTTAADGIRVDFDGGTATATSFIAGWEMVPGNTLSTYVNFSSTALATDLAISALSSATQRMLAVSFSIVCNAAGTFIPRVSENADGGGTLTVAAGSYMVLEDSPN